MRNKTRRTFSAEFRLESAQLIIDQNYSIREAAQAVGVGYSTIDHRRQTAYASDSIDPYCNSFTKWYFARK